MTLLCVDSELYGVQSEGISLYSGSNQTLTYVFASVGILVALALFAGLLIKYCVLNKKSISSPPGLYSWLAFEKL